MNIVLIVDLKFFFDLSDMIYMQVVYITYNMGNRDLPDIYAHALRLGHIYQANPFCPCLYIYTRHTHSVNASCSYEVHKDIICIHTNGSLEDVALL